MYPLVGPHTPFVDTDENRYKLLHVSPELVMSIFNSEETIFGTIRLHRLSGLPDGCQIRSVGYCDMSRCFVFRIYHPEFEPVPLGQTCEHFDVKIRTLEVPNPMLPKESA